MCSEKKKYSDMKKTAKNGFLYQWDKTQNID